MLLKYLLIKRKLILHMMLAGLTRYLRRFGLIGNACHNHAVVEALLGSLGATGSCAALRVLLTGDLA